MDDFIRMIFFLVAVALIGWAIVDTQQISRSNIILFSLSIGVLDVAAFETYLNIKEIAQRK